MPMVLHAAGTAVQGQVRREFTVPCTANEGPGPAVLNLNICTCTWSTPGLSLNFHWLFSRQMSRQLTISIMRNYRLYVSGQRRRGRRFQIHSSAPLHYLSKTLRKRIPIVCNIRKIYSLHKKRPPSTKFCQKFVCLAIGCLDNVGHVLPTVHWRTGRTVI